MIPTAFLIDDDRSVNFYNRWMLESEQIAGEIFDFGDAESAWEALQQRHANQQPLPGLILLDLNLPGMSGFDLMRRYRTLVGSTPPTVVILLLNSELLAGQEAEAEALGIQHLAFKPLQLNDLKAALGQS